MGLFVIVRWVLWVFFIQWCIGMAYVGLAKAGLSKYLRLVVLQVALVTWGIWAHPRWFSWVAILALPAGAVCLMLRMLLPFLLSLAPATLTQGKHFQASLIRAWKEGAVVSSYAMPNAAHLFHMS
jgi:hypothetical protein